MGITPESIFNDYCIDRYSDDAYKCIHQEGYFTVQEADKILDILDFVISDYINNGRC